MLFRSPKPQTPNPKPQTPNPKPLTFLLAIYHQHHTQSIMHCFICPSHPQLTKSQVDNDSIGTPTNIHCCGCGLPVVKGSYLNCTTCSKVQYCSKCKFCSKGHALTMVIDLVNLDSAYANNTYSCSVCKTNHVATDVGVYHCNACQYDLCPKCSDCS